MSLEDEFDEHLKSREANADKNLEKAGAKQDEATDKNAAPLRLFNLVIKPELEKAAELFRDKLGAQTEIIAKGRHSRTMQICLMPSMIVVAGHKRNFILIFEFSPTSEHITVYQKFPSSARIREPERIVLTFAEADEAKLAEIVSSFVTWSLAVLQRLDNEGPGAPQGPVGKS